MGARQELVGMFGGLTPSKGAVEVARKALSLGIDPSYHIDQAVKATLASGRNKVYVKPASPLDSLRETVVARSLQSQQSPRLKS